MKEEYTVFEKTIEKRDAMFADFPDELLPEIKSYLCSTGLTQLYSHQVEMFEAAQRNENVVITTSTASGKTLSFLLPVLQQILSNPSSRAIFIYPTKALASDQYRAIKPIIDYFGERKIIAGIYDGDTPVNERYKIRNSANIILTNPEMLNASFLPNHHKNSFIFSNLKFVIVDELHSYRGAFGSHLANIFCRLSRISRYYNSKPQFFCSSATIANPVELAENICQVKFTLIDKDGSPASGKQYHFIQTPLIQGTDIHKSVSEIAAQLIPELVVEGHSFITFCKSRKAVEVVLKESRSQLKSFEKNVPGSASLISGYRGGYKPQERKEIEQKMISGQLQGLISTNALELGIDIGKVDTTVLAGYPGTRASFWQQSGRAGRGESDSDAYLILDNLPADQYIAIDPEWLFTSESESAVVDKNNLFIQMAHIRAAAAELPITLDDSILFRNLGEILPVLIHAKELKTERGKFVWCGKEFPAGDYSLRNMDKERYVIVNTNNQSVIAELDEMQAFREAHTGAIYMHEGQSYLITSLNIEQHRAEAVPVDENYYTKPMSGTDVSIIKEQKEHQLGRSFYHFGDVHVTTGISMFKKIQFHNRQNLGYQQLNTVLEKSFDTEGVWIDLPDEVTETYNKLLPVAQGTTKRDFWKSYFGGLGYALQNAAMMVTMTTSEDISAAMIWNRLENIPKGSICVYDLYVGGLGYSEKAFDLMDKIVRTAIKSVSGCHCKDGCFVCVGDYHLDKRIVLWGLNSIYEQLQLPGGIKSSAEPPKIKDVKPYSIRDVSEHWNDITSLIAKQGGEYALFLSKAHKVIVNESTLTLPVESEFIREWVLKDNNRIQIKNIISQFVSTDGELIIDSICEEIKDKQEQKIMRHYNNLV